MRFVITKSLGYLGVLSTFLAVASFFMLFVTGGGSIVLAVFGMERDSAVLAEFASGFFGAFLIAFAAAVALLIIVRFLDVKVEPFMR